MDEGISEGYRWMSDYILVYPYLKSANETRYEYNAEHLLADGRFFTVS